MNEIPPEPPVSVVIPNYNGLRHLERLMPSLIAHSLADAELIVVDDASTDDSVAWLRLRFPQVQVLALPVNGGFCKACNAGLRAATGRVIVALNNDTEVLPGWIDTALPHFDDPSVGSVASLITKMHEPGVIDSAGTAYHACGWAYDRGHGQVDAGIFATEAFQRTSQYRSRQPEVSFTDNSLSMIPEGSQQLAGVSSEAKTPGNGALSIDPGGVAARLDCASSCDPSGVEIIPGSVPGVYDPRLMDAIPPGSRTSATTDADYNHPQPASPGERGESREVFGPTMACGFYRREALAKTGGLPEEFGAYFEDIDLAFRLRWAGYSCIYEPASRVLHAGSATYGKTSPRVTKLLARNEELAFWTNLPGRSLFFAFVPHLGFQAIRFARHTMTGRFRPFVEGKWEALRMLNVILRRRRFAQRLAPKGTRPDLHLEWSWKVFTRGLTWLKKRQNA